MSEIVKNEAGTPPPAEVGRGPSAWQTVRSAVSGTHQDFTQGPIGRVIYVSYGYICYAWGMVLVQASNGAGDTWTPTLIKLVCFWLFEIPLAYLLALRTGMGAKGVFLAITAAESLLAVIGLLVFRGGRWKKKKV